MQGSKAKERSRLLKLSNSKGDVVQGLVKAAAAIKKAKHIAISGHINPDGDSIGSMLALGLGLRQLGKCVHMISHDGVPERYSMLPGAGRIIKDLRGPVDLGICLLYTSDAADE